MKSLVIKVTITYQLTFLRNGGSNVCLSLPRRDKGDKQDLFGERHAQEQNTKPFIKEMATIQKSDSIGGQSVKMSLMVMI